MKRPCNALRSPRKALLGLMVVVTAHVAVACSTKETDPKPTSITFVAPTPAPVEIFWLDSAGNMGLRGVVAVLPGPPAANDTKYATLPETCRKSATANGTGALTVCLDPTVGKALAEKLGLDWTSGRSAKP